MQAFHEKINAWLVKYILKYNANKSELLNWNMQLSDVAFFSFSFSAAHFSGHILSM